MTSVGQIEKKTQQRVVKLFREQLGYAYLGDWTDREGNANIELKLLRAWLIRQGVEDALINRALHILEKAAGDTSKSLYDRNRAVYELLRYGVEIRPDVGDNTVTVWLIDWKHPEKNDFAIAEEVTVAGSDAKAHTKRPDVVLYVNGIALGVLELRRSTVSVAAGIRQNLDNQKKIFIARLNATSPWLVCSLIHNFGGKEEGEEVGDIPGYIAELKKALPPGFAAKGNLFVFVDECHRTQSGDLHEAMKTILPDWRRRRQELNAAPLRHESWTY